MKQCTPLGSYREHPIVAVRHEVLAEPRQEEKIPGGRTNEEGDQPPTSAEQKREAGRQQEVENAGTIMSRGDGGITRQEPECTTIETRPPRLGEISPAPIPAAHAEINSPLPGSEAQTSPATYRGDGQGFQDGSQEDHAACRPQYIDAACSIYPSAELGSAELAPAMGRV